MPVFSGYRPIRVGAQPRPRPVPGRAVHCRFAVTTSGRLLPYRRS